VVTSLRPEQWAAQALYEELYCAKARMRAWRHGEPDERAVQLVADRVSAETMRANQLRLYLSVMAYVLVSGLRRLGFKSNRLCASASSHDPYEVAEDRRAGTGDGP
jgi:hypothetical protein